LTETAPSPGLPYVTAAATDAETLRRLRDGLQAALDDPALGSVRDALMLEGAERLPIQVYGAIIEHETAARSAGYPMIA
jgi:hypothetical protein